MKKRKRSKVATIEQLLAATHRARHDWVHSQVYQNFEKGIRDCPENAGCYTAFKACQSLQGNQEIRPSDRARIEEVLARWKKLTRLLPALFPRIGKGAGNARLFQLPESDRSLKKTPRRRRYNAHWCSS